MPFERKAAVTPLRIGNTMIELFDPEPTTGQAQFAHVTVFVVMSDGTIQPQRHNLVDHFPPATINQLIAFVASVRAKAVAEILPAP